MSSDTVKFFTGILYFSSECNFHLFLCWSSSDILLSSDWILGLALSYAVCTYETRYWARPLPMLRGCPGVFFQIEFRFEYLQFFFHSNSYLLILNHYGIFNLICSCVICTLCIVIEVSDSCPQFLPLTKYLDCINS